VWLLGPDWQNELKTALRAPIQRQQIEQETKSSGNRGPAWREIELEIKESGRSNGLKDETKRGMSSG
jgi:hypothetical protein